MITVHVIEQLVQGYVFATSHRLPGDIEGSFLVLLNVRFGRDVTGEKVT